jgi:hypothetical protein
MSDQQKTLVGSFAGEGFFCDLAFRLDGGGSREKGLAFDDSRVDEK